MDTTDRSVGVGVPALIDELLSRIGERISGGRAEVVEAFAEAYTRRLHAEFADLSLAELAGRVAGAFELADGRGRAEATVRAFNPTPEQDGYETVGSVLQTNTEDSPFLFDSLSEELEERNLAVRRVIHPVVGTERGTDGRLVRVLHVREAETRESVMHFEVDRRLDDEELADLEVAVEKILGDVRLAVRDFGPMRQRVERMIELASAAASGHEHEDVDETVAFLRWLLDMNFVFLGYGEFALAERPSDATLEIVEGTALGMLADSRWRSSGGPPPAQARRASDRDATLGDPMTYSKTDRASTVHRRARMDSIGVPIVSAEGRLTGEARMVGLFTSKAYMEPARRTPILRRKLTRILRSEDLFEDSHDYKAVVSIFESFPKDELLAAPTEELREQVMGLLALQEQRHIRLFVRPDLRERSVSLLVVLPRDRFDAELRSRLQKLFMERFKGSTVDYHLSLGESQLAQLHFTVHVSTGHIPDVSFKALEEDVIELARTWDDRLRDRLVEMHGDGRGQLLADRWIGRFPDTYRHVTEVDVAVGDIERFEELEAGDEAFVVGLVNLGHETDALTRVRLFKVGGKIRLSDFVPTLESLGLQVVEEVPFDLIGDVAEQERFLHDFGVLGSDGHPLDVATSSRRIAECISAVWRGDCESDSLNRLVVIAGLDWREIQILRAYRKYHHRVNASFPVEYKNEAFAAHPHIAAKLIRLFELRFDPDLPRDPEAIERLRVEILADLDAVSSAEQDRILRNHLGLIEATVRTNAYRPERTALAFKFRSALVPEMPKPTPLFEIFVYSPEMEAIHLRGGKVARGGIRCSDRRQDYRTEILGLMKAQMVKNAVIVPTGSKGGFVLKRSIADPKALREEVTRQYVTFMRGMLDVTDDLEGGKVVHPERVVIHDEDDPYLVVAADKGTATLSDTANDVALSYGFWLGDAFASGGSAGYDHKELGITARGAWESVKRHFRELGTDVMTEPFTVVGVGDMSGDVFGNGMLLSDQICLVAAFDHRHIFIDPSPAPAVGFAERQRLFALPGSSWDDYDRSKISVAGGVWPRAAKVIPISPEVRLALGLEGESLTPDELIGGILRAPVDLLWNGGIGTYVKATTELHAEAGDRVNDGLRVNGAELRCRVAAEGGNLGFTQRGRIEFAMRGGRINTDFIDNSAGVDCSDHEVNLKILLGLAMQEGALSLDERNALLAEVEQDVTRHVLYDNFLQAQILSQEHELSPSRMEAYEDLMQSLESEGVLERELEALPSTEEMAERRRAGKGMARPELAVLLAYAKQSLANALLASTLPDSAYLEQDLRAYFPSPVVERLGHLIPQHALRRELIATIVANDVVNSQGITFVTRLVAETGASPSDAVSAYRIARDVTGAVARWEAIESLVGAVEPGVLDELMGGVDHLVEVASRWYLSNAHQQLGRVIEAHREPFARYDAALYSLAPEPWRMERERAAWRLMDRGVSEETARRHALQPALAHGPNVVSVAEHTGRSVEDVASVFLAVGDAVFIDWLEARLTDVPATTRWHRWALQAAEDDLLLARGQIAERVLAEWPSLPPDAAVSAFLAARSELLARLSRFMRAFALEEVSDLAAVTVAVRQIRAVGG